MGLCLYMSIEIVRQTFLLVGVCGVGGGVNNHKFMSDGTVGATCKKGGWVPIGICAQKFFAMTV